MSKILLRAALLILGTSVVAVPSLEQEAAFGASPTVALETKVLNVVILGDSYSAGNGAWRTLGDPESRVYFGPVPCMRSPFNWGRRYRTELRSLRGAKVSYANHACSGATSADIGRPNRIDRWARSEAMPSPPIESDQVNAYANAHGLCGMLSNYTDEQYVVAEDGRVGYVRPGVARILFNCSRYLRPQQDFVGPQTDLVLLTIGGNDLQFGEIVKQCFAPVVRDRETCEGLLEDADHDLDEVRSRIVTAIEGLFGPGRLGPNARVVLLGYPLLAMRDSGYELDDAPVAEMVRTLGLKGEAMLSQMVRSINDDEGNPARGKVIFASGIPGHFAGHEPNPDYGDGNPNGGWLHEMVSLGKWKMEDFHPNPLGHEQYMRHLVDDVPGGDAAFGAGASRQAAGDLDLVFAIDVSESMDAELVTLKKRLSSVMGSARARANTVRFALVSFREDPRFSGDPGDYTSRLEQDFTDDPAQVVAAANKLVAQGGGGNRETMFSGLMTGLGLAWRPAVKKSVIAVSDNWPHSPEPFTGIDAATVVDKAWSVDPAAISIVDTGNATDNEAAQAVITETAGRAFVVAEDEVENGVVDAVDEALDRPHAWITDPTVARVGSTVEIDGSGSYSPTGEIVSYAWDFDGDRVPDQTTDVPEVTHTFDQEFTGSLALIVTDEAGRRSIATQHVGITVDGDEIPTESDNCPDAENMAQTDTDEDGLGDVCDPTPGPTVPDDPAHTRPSKLVGIPRPSNTLTADPGEWNYPAAFTFQWMLDGVDIAGATTPDYVVQTGDVGHRVGVRIIARIEDFGTVKTETLETMVEPQPLTMVSPSSVLGEPRAGRRLAAVPSRWSGPTTAAFQWLRGGTPIPGATQPTYRLGPRDVRHRVTVQITTTAREFGTISVDRHGYRVRRYASHTALRLRTRAVYPGAVIATIRVSTHAPKGSPGRVRIMDGNRVVAAPRIKSGRVTVWLHDLLPGDHRLRAKYLGSDLTARSRSHWRYMFVPGSSVTREEWIGR